MTIRVGTRVRILGRSRFAGMVGTVEYIDGGALGHGVLLDDFSDYGPVPFDRSELVYTT